MYRRCFTGVCTVAGSIHTRSSLALPIFLRDIRVRACCEVHEGFQCVCLGLRSDRSEKHDPVSCAWRAALGRSRLFASSHSTFSQSPFFSLPNTRLPASRIVPARPCDCFSFVRRTGRCRRVAPTSPFHVGKTYTENARWYSTVWLIGDLFETHVLPSESFIKQLNTCHNALRKHPFDVAWTNAALDQCLN